MSQTSLSQQRRSWNVLVIWAPHLVVGKKPHSQDILSFTLVGSLPQTISSAQHFHSEQGPILESSKSQIGVVLGAQGYKWCTVEVFGRSCHTGTTPFHARSDPMLGAARIISMSHEVAKKYGGLGSTVRVEYHFLYSFRTQCHPAGNSNPHPKIDQHSPIPCFTHPRPPPPLPRQTLHDVVRDS